MSNSKIGTIHVSMELLAKLLHFPVGHSIVDIRRVDTTPYGAVEVLCAGPTLPDVADGAEIPMVEFTVKQMFFEGSFSTKAQPTSEEHQA